MNGKSVLVAIALATSLLGFGRTAEACKCIPPTISSSYNNSTDVVRARVVFGVSVGGSKWYLARVLSTYKGCLKPGSWLYVRTGASSAECGVELKNGVQYLINGSQDETANYKVPVVWVNSCGYNRPVSELTKADRKFLVTRYNCCGESCACVNGQPPVNCFADPCQVNDCPAGECQANYCGGCHAEFYDDYGSPVCQACQTSSDCGWNQVCSVDGMCLPTCSSDADCNDGFWCRPTQDAFMDPSVPAEAEVQGACTAYAGEGESCGGFTPIWWQTKCAPGLICTDFPPFIADAPGKCRKECKTSADCDEGDYCSESGVCREDGACQSQSDCSAEGNNYITVKCLGYALCIEDKCDYKCGYPLCPNLEGVFFGYCDAILGWGNIGGSCQVISGCDSDGIELFPSEEKCKSTCGFSPPGECTDLKGVDFGLCKMIVGYGVVGGQCQMIGGCSDEGYSLFDSLDACKESCPSVVGPTCDDLGGVEFGACQMVLGVAVVDGSCSYVSGCGAQGYLFYDDLTTCEAACGK